MRILLCFMVMCSAVAQKGKPTNPIQQKYKHTAIALGGGSTHYLGELAPYSTPLSSLFTQPRWNGTIEYIKHNSPFFATKLIMSWIRLAGSDYVYGKKDLLNTVKQTYSLNYIRNLHFRNDIKEVGIQTILKIREQDRDGYISRDKFVPYVAGGLSFFVHNPKAKIVEQIAPATPPAALAYAYSNFKPGTSWEALRPLKTEGQSILPTYPKSYPIFGASVPMSIGTFIKISRSFDINFEATANITSSKYLDDVSGSYPNPKDLPGNNQLNPSLPPPIGQDAYPLTIERITSNPSKVPFDPLSGESRIDDITNIGITFGPNLANSRGFDNNNFRGNNLNLVDSYLTFKIKLVYYLGKKVVCPPL